MKSVKQNAVRQSTDWHGITLSQNNNSLLNRDWSGPPRASDGYKKNRPSEASAQDSKRDQGIKRREVELDPQVSPEEIIAGRWSWAAKVGLLSLRVVPQQQCNGHCPCDCPARQLKQQLRSQNHWLLGLLTVFRCVYLSVTKKVTGLTTQCLL